MIARKSAICAFRMPVIQHTEFLTVTVPDSDLILSSSSALTILLEQSNWARVTRLQWMIICPGYPVLLGAIL